MAKITRTLTVDHWERYFENPTQKYYNPEKKSIQLLQWPKHGSFIRHVPDNFCPAGTIWYAILRGYNCQAQCHYCFLQTYFKSADMVKFTNVEHYLPFLETFIKAFRTKYGAKQQLVFFDGDFHDSLWYVWLPTDIEQINLLTTFLSQFPNTYLEIKTKCLIQPPQKDAWDIFTVFDKIYGKLQIVPSLITAITFSPEGIIEQYEPWTASLKTRIWFAQYIAHRWWTIGCRIDPIILAWWTSSALDPYIEMIETIQQDIDQVSIKDRWLWHLRLKDALYKRLKQDSSWLITWLVKEGWFRTYPQQTRKKLYGYLEKTIDSPDVFYCMEEEKA